MKKEKNTLKICLFVILSLFYSVPAISQPITLVTIGDSLTAGDGDSEGGGGYPSRLLAMLVPLYPDSTISNLGISGDTTLDLVNKQLNGAVTILNNAPTGSIKMVLVWIGSNDLFGLYAGDVCSEYYSSISSCEEMEMGYAVDNLDTILGTLASTGATIYIALLDDQSRRPVITDESLRSNSFPGITADEIPRMASQIALYNAQVKQQAVKHGAKTVDFFNTAIFENSATLDYDGNHPNSSGYDAIASIWYQSITGTSPPDTDDTDGDDTVNPPAAQPPVPSIMSGNSHNTISVNINQSFPVSVSMNAGDMLNKAGDWWLIYITPDNKIFSLTNKLRWIEGVSPVLSIPLISFDAIQIFSTAFPLPGTYSFYFAFDDKPDGIPELPIWIDALTVQVNTLPTDPTDKVKTRLMPQNLIYQGAFLLPEGDEWAYSGHALAWYPDGNPDDSGDGYPGSIYTAAHAIDGYVGEISIPAPVKADTIINLPRAEIIQSPKDITGGLKDKCTFDPECLYRELDGLAYLPNINKIVWNLRDWYNAAGFDQDSLGWSNPDMSDPQGVWHIGSRESENNLFHNAKTSNYLFNAPQSFTTQWLDGKSLIAGSSREAGVLGGSQGPTLFALAPWEDGNPPAPSSNLDAIALLYYPEKYDCVWENAAVCDYPGYSAADHWNGGAWIETASANAVIISGRKGLGSSCYGTPEECGNDTCVTSKGYHAYPYQPQVLFYDPEDLKAVRAGTKSPWQVLPYEILSLENITYNQGCAAIGAAALDSDNGYLYITEKEIDDVENGIWGVTAVHVWKIQ
ncbi:MAG: hypothetical protein HQK67_04440 [Desulfamplus sp.]|nr:hypothetical protein [Desulfamplus sp.]